ncbi:conserved hypothetical protein [Enterococcus faecium E980]|uniref:hypothetical protein n=1 Tax=Enterococcus faecium TaxID=1352 RepID=UPI0001CEAC20|nr:hypothetical protein [Enterococcus faecium]EFF38529.1 conserved hypothetical protein [Enterococcus faecium E980]
MKFRKIYLLENCEKELRANVSVSILMANVRALPYALKKFRNFDEVANYFFLRKAALKKESSSTWDLLEDVHLMKRIDYLKIITIKVGESYCIFFNKNDSL